MTKTIISQKEANFTQSVSNWADLYVVNNCNVLSYSNTPCCDKKVFERDKFILWSFLLKFALPG